MRLGRSATRSTVGASPQTRVVWLTNRAAPYRRPVWRSVARQLSLSVLLLEAPTRLAKGPGNRGLEWATYEDEDYPIADIRTLRWSRGESNYYLTAGLPIPGPRPHAVVLGGWESPSYWQALVQAKISGIRTIGFYESTLQSQRHRRGLIGNARGTYFRMLDRIVVPGRAARDAVLAMGVDPRRIDLGFNAVDVEGIYSAVRQMLAERGDEVSASRHRYLFIGQFIPRKNPLTLIRAFAQIRRPLDRLTLVGQGELLEAIRSLIKTLDLTDAVEVRPMVAYERIPELLQANNTLVLPSTEEVWGLVVNEALAGGLHVVVSKQCGVTESVEHMRGVYTTDTESGQLGKRLVESRRAWQGHIVNPEILAYTPEAFAEVFISSIRAATESGQELFSKR